MQLTNSALSMLLKRYRAVLFKCRTLNWLGGTVLAAGLVLGAASGALAKDVVWTEGSQLAPTPTYTEDSLTIKEGTFSIGPDQTPAGINLTISDGAKITLNGDNYYTTSLFGYSAAADADDAAAVPTTITGAGTQVTVTKGAVGAGLPGNGGGSGYEFLINDGAKITLQGENKDEAVILASALREGQMTTTISGQGTTVEVLAAKKGTFSAPHGNVAVTNGAELKAAGQLDLIAGGLKKVADYSYVAANASTAQFTVNKGGKLTVAESTGTLNLHKGVTLTVAGDGVLENKGAINVGVAASENATLDVSALADPLAALGVGGTGKVVVAGVAEGQYSKLVVGDRTIAAADLVKAADAADGKIALGDWGSLQAQKLTLTGSTLAIDADGRINTEQLTVDGETGLTLSSGLIRLRGEKDSSLTGKLTLDGADATKAELRLGTANDAGTAANPGGALNADITATKGTVAVNAGIWALAEGKTLDIGANGVLTVGGDTTGGTPLSATLDVTQGTIKAASGADLTVSNLGTLVAGKDQLLKNADDVSQTALADDFQEQVTLNSGSTLKITGYDEIDSAQMKKNAELLLETANGLVDYDGATLTATGGLKDEGDGSGSAEGTTAIWTGETVQAGTAGTTKDETATLGGGYGAQDIIIATDSATETVAVNSNGNLTLLGTGEGNKLIDTGDATLTSVKVADSKEFNLGYANNENSRGGALDAAVSLGSGSSLTTYEAAYTVGAVDGTAANQGSVKADADSSLTAASIGAANGVASVAANGGDITSTGVIKTQTLTATDGVVSAGDDITAANAVSVTNGGIATQKNLTFADALTSTDGVVSAKGDIDVTGAATLSGTSAVSSSEGDVKLGAGATVSGGSATIQAAAGGIDAAGQNLTAAKGAGLTLSAQEAIKAADVTATNVGATTLTAGGNVAVSDGTLTLTGTDADKSTVGGTLDLTGVKATVAELEVTGPATVDGGTFSGETVTTTAGATFQNGAKAGIDTLTTTSGDIRVGTDADTQGGTTLVVNSLGLGGNALVVDPAWGQDSSVAIVNKFATADVVSDGDIAVGQNSLLAFGPGASAAWLDEQVAAAVPGGTLSEDGVNSVVALQGPLTIGSGHKVFVGGNGMTGASLTAALGGAAADSFTQQANTLLIVNGAADGVSYTGNAKATTALPEGVTGAISAEAAATATVDAGARLHIAGAEVGKTYVVLGENITTTFGDDTAWSGAALTGDNPLVTLARLGDDKAGQVGANLNSAGNVMPKLDSELVGAINAAAVANQIGTGERFVNSPEKGVRFLSRAIAPDYLDAAANPDLAAQTIEGAARMITIGAVPQMTRAANQAAGEAVTQRTGLAQPTGIQTQEAGDHFALWIMPLYQSVNGFGMEAGNFDADFNGGLGGVAIGADYTFANAIRAGITFNIGGGYATGGGDFADTTNSMNFWGIGAYAGWTKNNFGLAADVNFTSAYNELEQDLPAAMDMRDLKADVRSYAFSTGLRGEYKLETDVLDIIPHVGVRYMYLSSEDYKVKSEGTVLKGDGLNQNIWTFPVGVSFSKSIDTGNGWHFKPMVDLSVIPAAGDIKARENVRFTGTDTRAELETQIMDYITYQGGLGFEVGNENLAFGLNGNVQFGAQTSGYGVLGTFRYEF